MLAGQLPPLDALDAMANSLYHRGPDDQGVWSDHDAGVAMGFRRLAIVDLSVAGCQPMRSSSGRYVIAFNGEIYNYRELRAALEDAHQEPERGWRGHSDTETLVECLAAWGIVATLQRVVGMFAFAVWDRAERRLWLARDRFGEKPLYYGWTQNAFVFGSELKALRHYPGFDNPIDRDVLALYAQYSYVPAPYSIYRSIYKLEPGCVMCVALEAAASPPSVAPIAPGRHDGFSLQRYWSFVEVAHRGLAHPLVDEGEAIDRLERVLSEAVRLQSIADVPLGAFLSGGVDSSTIVALMQVRSTRKVKTLTIGFMEEGLNEATHAKAIARHLGTDHSEVYVSVQEASDIIPCLPSLYSEPFADSSQIPTHVVSRIARQYVTVALSGDGGDELFGGYRRYVWGRRIAETLRVTPPALRRAMGMAMQQVPMAAWDRLFMSVPTLAHAGNRVQKLGYGLERGSSVDGLYQSIVTEWPPETEVVIGARPLPLSFDRQEVVRGVVDIEHRMMIWDTLTYLPDDVLHKVDRAAMGVSLETRVPFLDHRVAELAWQLPVGMKIRGGRGKVALRQLLSRYVPKQLAQRPKMGFGIPLASWLRGPLRPWAEDLLASSRLRADGFFNPEPIRAAWEQHVSGKRNLQRPLWAILMFQAWLRHRSS